MNIKLALKWQKLQSTTKPNDFFWFWLNRTLLWKFKAFLHLKSLLTPIVFPMKGTGILEFWKFFLWNPESWAFEYGIQLKESGIPLKNGIQDPGATDKDGNPEFTDCAIMMALYECSSSL